MTAPSSNFADKLRSYRALNGKHGRMSQEQLAALLGLSVDAISKYERSLSYIRGDLEHLLIERLGWTRDEVVACRQDWENRSSGTHASYRVLREHEVAQEYGSIEFADAAVQALELASAHEFPDGFSACDPIWAEILEDGAMSGVYVMVGDELAAHISLIFLDEDLEARFRECRLVEAEFSLGTLRRPVLPGDYFGYCAGVYIAHEHQKSALHLLNGFVKVLEDLVNREVYLKDLAAIAASPIGHQLCKDLSFQFIGPHFNAIGLEFWRLAGENIPNSLFARRSPVLKKAYADRFEIT
ncbi:Helix-turn-helix [Ruegeria halocynthiae]|uniref:Helix-turn-helix n=1 Tax=Ruegeria halocynthiae TaxID=985054 RepID=A0A1H3FVI0_9RHOB|nr:helix-turn-helix transcriptional regulator [Ruegeria halocynthiae]SDX94940.1 Helix-turn-helix [Ruegeria halocynthiae]